VCTSQRHEIARRQLFDETLTALAESLKGANLFIDKVRQTRAVAFGSGGAMGVALVGALKAWSGAGVRCALAPPFFSV
jgi:hypothetical protein